MDPSLSAYAYSMNAITRDVFDPTICGSERKQTMHETAIKKEGKLSARK